jgi:hypothetical protein
MRFVTILICGFAVIGILPTGGGFGFGPAYAQGPSGQSAPIGKVITATGAVTIEHAVAVVLQANLSSSSGQAKAGDFVYRGDVIETAADSKVSITFTDGTAFNVSSNARMELTEFVYNPNGTSNSSFFSLVKGAFTFIAGAIAKTGDMKVDTPVATMGIRGTTPSVEILENGSVRFATLVEEVRANPAAKTNGNQPKRRAAQKQGKAFTPTDISRQEDEAYKKMINMEYKLCRGC